MCRIFHLRLDMFLWCSYYFGKASLNCLIKCVLIKKVYLSFIGKIYRKERCFTLFKDISSLSWGHARALLPWLVDLVKTYILWNIFEYFNGILMQCVLFIFIAEFYSTWGVFYGGGRCIGASHWCWNWIFVHQIEDWWVRSVHQIVYSTK